MHATGLLESKDLQGHCFARTWNIAINISVCCLIFAVLWYIEKKESDENLRLKHLPHTPTNKLHPQTSHTRLWPYHFLSASYGPAKVLFIHTFGTNSQSLREYGQASIEATSMISKLMPLHKPKRLKTAVYYVLLPKSALGLQVSA